MTDDLHNELSALEVTRAIDVAVKHFQEEFQKGLTAFISAQHLAAIDAATKELQEEPRAALLQARERFAATLAEKTRQILRSYGTDAP